MIDKEQEPDNLHIRSFDVVQAWVKGVCVVVRQCEPCQHCLAELHRAVKEAMLSAKEPETLRIMHARKQGGADGFQEGWHAALSRIREGDSPESLFELVPSFDIYNKLQEAEAKLAASPPAHAQEPRMREIRADHERALHRAPMNWTPVDADRAYLLERIDKLTALPPTHGWHAEKEQ